VFLLGAAFAGMPAARLTRGVVAPGAAACRLRAFCHRLDAPDASLAFRWQVYAVTV
jgi:hypothetical protein